ncbi:hypothetical protein Smp_197630 [Schistosoma mansoni]|uniref:hypothetical protein n=1 Tax=Schistosoma mansoni TaxID=6183 RepID=UPI00022DC57A|nr:hypothetical protein Smp_197630 [Schistosoma mansoni]|eukprot:XP_018651450.1 hypothetical protein Smp_197630 [Schistosoma mansoni]
MKETGTNFVGKCVCFKCNRFSFFTILFLGIIYDSELGITGEALINRFNDLYEKIEYYADFPIRNYSLPSPPKFKLTIKEFTFGVVCNLVQNDVHVIISLTACNIAQLIEAQTIPYGIPYIAIPRPTCSKEIINLSNIRTTTMTLWIQPTSEQTGRAIYEMSELERVSQALLLVDKTNLETDTALDFVLQAEMNDEKFVPYISTQMFSLTNQTNPMYPTLNTYDTIDVLLRRFEDMRSNSSSFLLSHIFHIQVSDIILMEFCSLSWMIWSWIFHHPSERHHRNKLRVLVKCLNFSTCDSQLVLSTSMTDLRSTRTNQH